METGRIKLKARDEADLTILSACLQDALVPVREMAFLPKQHRFVLVANRFRWEAQPEGPLPPELPPEAEAEADAPFAEAAATFYSRVNCGLCFDRVLSVKTRNLDLRRGDRLLSLLAIHAEPDGRAVRLVFAGDAQIRLEVRGIVVLLEDLGEAWPTQWRPSHAEDDPTLDEPGAAG